MSAEQKTDANADDPDLIRLNKRSLFTPSASVAVEQHSAVPHVSRSTYGTAKVEGRLTSPNARVPEIITQRCGGITVKGHPRVAELAMVAEMQGAAGVVINAPAPAETIETTMSMVDIPVIATVTEDDEITECKILAGAAIINVAAGARTAQVVASIRAHHPEIPILASGGGREDRILATIDAGADAITWTPPSAQQLQSQMMAKYRGEV